MTSSSDSGDLEYVKGYTKKDGTKVDGFYRARKKGSGSSDAPAPAERPSPSRPTTPVDAGLPLGWDDMGSSAKDLWIERNGWPDTKLSIYAGALEPGDRFEDEWGNEAEVVRVESKGTYVHVRTAGGQHVFHRGNTVMANKSRPAASVAAEPPAPAPAPADKVNAGLAALRQQRVSTKCPHCGEFAGTSHNCPGPKSSTDDAIEPGWRTATEDEKAAWAKGQLTKRRARLVPGKGLILEDEDSGPGRCDNCGQPVAHGQQGHTCPTRDQVDDTGKCPACGQFASDDHTCDPAAAREGYERFFEEVDPDDDALIEYAEKAPWYHGPDPASFFAAAESGGDWYEARGRLINSMEAELGHLEAGGNKEKCPDCGEFMGANHLCNRLGPHDPGAREIRACREVDGSVESWNPDYQQPGQEPEFYTLYEADKTGLMMAVDDYDTLAEAQAAMNPKPPRCDTCGEYAGDEHACKPVADRPGAIRDQEAVALEYATEAIAERLEEAKRHPTHYTPEDLEAMRDQHAQLVNRQTYLTSLANAAPDQRLQMLWSQQREIQRQTENVALDSIREVARELAPRAAYFTLESSDQGSYMSPGRLYDAEGRELELDDYAFSDRTDDLASYLSEDYDGALGPWKEQRVQYDDLPEQLRVSKGTWTSVIKIDKETDQ